MSKGFVPRVCNPVARDSKAPRQPFLPLPRALRTRAGSQSFLHLPAGTPHFGAESQASGDTELAEPDSTSHLPLTCLYSAWGHDSVCPGRVVRVAAPAGAGSEGLHLGRRPRCQPAAALPPGVHLHLNTLGWSWRSQLSGPWEKRALFL